MKLHLNKTFKALNGEDIKVHEEGNEKEVLTIGKVLANLVLSQHKTKKGFRPLKAYELAKKFYDQNEVEVDQADFIQLRELVEESPDLMPIITAQILEEFEASK